MIAQTTVVGLLLAFAAEGQPPAKPGSRKPPAPPKPTKVLPAFSPEREAAAFVFIRQNHPELADILQPLKEMSRQQYEDAVRELFQKSEQLSEMAIRDPDSHALALQDWKLQSRIEVATARLTHGADPKMEKELHKLIESQADVRIKRKQLERDRAAANLQRIEAQLAKMRDDREQQIEAQYRRLMRAKDRAAKQ